MSSGEVTRYFSDIETLAFDNMTARISSCFIRLNVCMRHCFIFMRQLKIMVNQ